MLCEAGGGSPLREGSPGLCTETERSADPGASLDAQLFPPRSEAWRVWTQDIIINIISQHYHHHIHTQRKYSKIAIIICIFIFLLIPILRFIIISIVILASLAHNLHETADARNNGQPAFLRIRYMWLNGLLAGLPWATKAELIQSAG